MTILCDDIAVLLISQNKTNEDCVENKKTPEFVNDKGTLVVTINFCTVVARS